MEHLTATILTPKEYLIYASRLTPCRSASSGHFPGARGRRPRPPPRRARQKERPVALGHHAVAPYSRPEASFCTGLGAVRRVVPLLVGPASPSATSTRQVLRVVDSFAIPRFQCDPIKGSVPGACRCCHLLLDLGNRVPRLENFPFLLAFKLEQLFLRR